MEVASFPAHHAPAGAADDNNNGAASDHVNKRLLQGRPLPAILVDNHPGPRYPTFRPHQRRLSQQKGGGGGREGASTPCDSGVSFSSPEGGDPLPHLLASTSKISFGKPGARDRKRKKKRRTPVAVASNATPSQGTGTTVGTGTTTTTTATATTAAASSTLGGGGGGGGAGMMSSTSSGVSSERVSEQLHRKALNKGSRMGHHGRLTAMEGTDYSVNPEPVPFMPSNFMSSTMLKKIPIPKRHQDTFGGYEYNFTGQRGVMLHTDRYQVRKQYEALKNLEGLNQRDRLLAEMAYLDDLRSIRRRREVVPHRVQLDLFLGGKKLQYEERFDIKKEIQRLKAMAMPDRARDLFHGKGILLPPTHLSLLPRHTMLQAEDSDSEEEVRISAPASVQRTVDHSMDIPSPTFERQISLTLGDVPHTRSVIGGKRHTRLPSISKNQTPRGGAAREDTSLSLSQTSMPQTNRSAAWVEEQNQLLSGSRKTNITGPKKPATTDSSHKEEHPPQPKPSLSYASVAGKSPAPHHPQQPPSSSPSFLPSQSLESTSPIVGSQRPARGGESRDEDSQQQQRVVIKEDEERVTRQDGRQPSPPVSHTPNPLKSGMQLDVSEEQESSLRQTFQRLDTDMDGHLQYHQLKSQLPKEFSHQQEWFVKQVYEITRSSAVFFGVDEFLMMTQLTNRVAALTGQAQEAYGKIDFDTLEACIIKYVDLFQAADSGQKGRISAEALRQLLGTSQGKAPPDDNSPVWNTVLDFLSLDYASNVNRIEYLAHIPLFMALAPPTLPPPPSQSTQPSSPTNEL